MGANDDLGMRGTRPGVAVELDTHSDGDGYDLRSVELAATALPSAERRGEVLSIVAGTRVRQYELIRELGRGGMGMVWLARDTKLGRRVAIKFLLRATRRIADRFLAEARATAQCNHDHIVIIHEVDEYEGLPYMVLELLEGHTLREQLKHGTRLATPRIVELALPIARALARAHELGIVHRDLKPENVLVTNAGQVKVLDFGIAKALRDPGRAATSPGELDAKALDQLHDQLHATNEGAIVGTLPYMSPEQMGLGEVDHRSDLWSLGVMLFEMLAGQHPVQPLTFDALIANAVEATPVPSVRTVAPDADPNLVALIDGCLQKKQAARIARASDVVKALEALRPGHHGRALGDGESPYPGLVAFQEGDADRFFGRDRDVARVVARIRERPITAVIGPSGAGKSSVIRAGAAPALKASDPNCEVVLLRPGRQPLAALASVIQQVTTRSGVDLETRLAEHRELATRLRTEPGYLGALLRGRALQRGGQTLVVVDQFEELYTLVTDREERCAFTAALAAIADDPSAPLRVVISMRSDFLDRVVEDPRFADELTQGLVLIAPPDRAGLRQALVSPLEAVGHRFESAAMIEDMLDALATTAGALPLLQFAASKLWDARDRSRKLITVSSYNAIGGIGGALASHADEVIAQMNPAAQKLAERVFRRLVTPDRTRAIVELGDLQELGAEAGRVVEQLVAARLLVVDGQGRAASVEIVHESLLDTWPALRRWLDDDQDDAVFLAAIGTAARQWDAKNRPLGLLWRGDAMEEARRWYALRPRELPLREQAFLDAVFALARRGKRARRATLIGLFILLGAIATAATIAMLWIRNAEHSTKTALLGMQEKERQRIAAEDRKADAERAAIAAANAKVAAEKGQAAAQAAQQVIAHDADVQKQKSREELDRENQKLVQAAEEANRLRAKAEKTAADLAAAKQGLEQSKAAVVEENRRLKEKNDELQKLTTHLKGM